MTRFKPPACYKCSRYRETECAWSMSGYPDAGELCQQWDTEAGTDAAEREGTEDGH